MDRLSTTHTTTTNTITIAVLLLLLLFYSSAYLAQYWQPLLNTDTVLRMSRFCSFLRIIDVLSICHFISVYIFCVFVYEHTY